jgi:hypothetical protein
MRTKVTTIPLFGLGTPSSLLREWGPGCYHTDHFGVEAPMFFTISKAVEFLTLPSNLIAQEFK